jgi:hypothetical protein
MSLNEDNKSKEGRKEDGVARYKKTTCVPRLHRQDIHRAPRGAGVGNNSAMVSKGLVALYVHIIEFGGRHLWCILLPVYTAMRCRE